jgi:histidinol dehydrogenase/sulfopropanediol 3-dehydrogenase
MDIAGADEIYVMGGAQAVGAFAYGTETVGRVDIIVGPGNRYVTEAKRQVSGTVGIDMLAGPSEVVIIADDSAPVEWIAADALSNCEHDPNARSVVIALGEGLARAVADEISRALPSMENRAAAEASWDAGGMIVAAESEDEAVSICDGLAPEHVQVMTRDSASAAARLRNFGSLFIGPYSPVPFGDYASGPNHILPTMGCARFSNGVNVGTFMRTCSFQEITKEGARALAPACAALAGLEGLFGHKRSAELRG